MTLQAFPAECFQNDRHFVRLPVIVPFVLDEDHFELLVAEHAPAFGGEEKFELRGAMFPREEVDGAMQMAPDGGVPPAGEGEGADHAAVRHAAQRVDAGRQLRARESGRLFVGDVAGGVVAPACEGGEQLPPGAFEDEAVRGEVVGSAEAVHFGEHVALVLRG